MTVSAFSLAPTLCVVAHVVFLSCYTNSFKHDFDQIILWVGSQEKNRSQRHKKPRKINRGLHFKN